LLIKGLVSRADAGVPEDGSGRDGCGVECHATAEAFALAAIFKVTPLVIFESRGPEDQPEDLKKVQQELDAAIKDADTASDRLDRQAKILAYLRGRVEKIAWRMNEAAAQQQREEQSGSEA
jgi:uncharacterized Zn finger protein